MFLDDELLEMCKKADLFTAEGVDKLNVDICDKCQEYYRQRITQGMPKREAKVIFDKTFKLFDSFVRQAKNSKQIKLQIVGEMFEKNSFKQQFMNNEHLKKLYEEL
jgi:hypothetical protein